jgi:hypothetical protein
MKKLLFIPLLLVGITSCSDDPETVPQTITESVPNNQYKEFEYSDMDVYHIQEIDGCEYILVNGRENSEPALTHKGNCKYCLERNKQSVIEVNKKEEY